MKQIAVVAVCAFSCLSATAVDSPTIRPDRHNDMSATDIEPGRMTAGLLSEGQYSVEYDKIDFAHFLWERDGEIPRFPITITTPVFSRGLTAELEVDNGYHASFSTLYPFDAGVSAPITLIFDEPLDIGNTLQIGYTIRVTPNYEGAETTVITGSLIRGIYPTVALMEEYTGTWCGYCIRGAAFMAYYADNLGMAEEKGRFIGMTIHGDDVMEPPYFSEIAPLLPAPSYPYAFLNRSVSGDPASMPVSRTLTEKSTGNLKISRVDYSSSAGSAMTVHYGTALSYNTQDPVVRVSAYIIEDDVKSTASNYKQKNNYSGYSDGEIARVFGEALVPYFQNYIKYPAEIPASRMTYNDVARAAFPSAKGELQTEPYTAFVFNEGSIQMSMPSNVMNPENTSVVVVMADREGKNVMSADVVKFADYNKELYTFSGQPVYPEGYSPITKIDVCPAENEILIEDGKIRVLTSVPATILVHSLDGTLIAKSEKGSGESVLHPETKGLVIVTVRTASGVSTKKLIL